MTDKLDFLEGEPEPEVKEEDGKAAEEEIKAEPETPDEPEPAKGEPDAAPPAAAEEEKPGNIPISALLDERERRQKAEREAEELRKWRAQIEAEKKQPAPDFFQDPDQRLAYERKQLEQRQVTDRLKQSRFFAEREYGADLVKEAYAYFDQHPQLSHQFLDHPSPFHAAVEFYKRQKVADEIGADPDAWKAKQIEALREQIKAEVMAELSTAQPDKPRLPGSLASAPAAGKAGEPQARGSAFDAAFGS